MALPMDLLSSQLHAIYRIASAISVAEVEAYVAEIERTDTLLPIVDPTAYSRIRQNIPQHRTLVQKFLEFRRELAKYEPVEDPV